jgi:hypothetical protein
MSRRPAPLLVPLALAFGLAGGARAARAEDDAPTTERYSLRAELGPELDTNAHRTEIVNVAGVANPPLVASPLARGVLAGTLSDVVADGQELALSATAAAKIFERSAARDEDVAIGEATFLWRASVGERAALSLFTVYYEAFQREAPPPVYSLDRRDFRSISPTLRLAYAVGEHAEAALAGGYRAFVFKSDRSYDFQAPTAGLDLRWARETTDGAADWEAAFHASYERRAFDGHPYVATTCPPGETCPPVSGTGDRLDHFATGSIEVERTGRVLVGGGYALHVNLSNSFGETVTRHFVTAHFAAALPLDLFVSARAEILFAHYADEVVVAETEGAAAGRAFVSIEDENRNSARIDLSRNLGDRLQLIARYTIYSNELGASDVTYRRQTALLSLAFLLEK